MEDTVATVALKTSVFSRGESAPLRDPEGRGVIKRKDARRRRVVSTRQLTRAGFAAVRHPIPREPTVSCPVYFVTEPLGTSKFSP